MYSEDLKRDLIELGVEVNGIGQDTLRDTLVSRLASLHPDKTGGQFHEEEQENSFLRIKGLLERLDSETSISSQLIPINQVVTLVDILSKLQATNAAGSEPKHAEVSDRYKNYLKRKYALPKITSAIVAGLCFALFSLLGSFRQNPLYRSAVDFYVQDSKGNTLEWTGHQAQDFAKEWLDLDQKAAFVEGQISRLNGAEDRYARMDRPKSSDILGELYRRFTDTERGELHKREIDFLVEKNNLTDINLFDSAEPDFLLGFKTSSGQMAKDLSSTVTRLNSINPSDPYWKEYKVALITFLLELQNSLTSFDGVVKVSESQLAKQKTRALNQADGRILRRLALLTVSAFLMFILLWVRERSDERWVDFMSTEEGAEVVLARLCANNNIMERKPPGFSLREFIEIVGTKDVPRVLSPVVGSALDVKRLGQISSFLIDKLKKKKVISERTTLAFQTWFDVHVKDVKTAEDQEVSSDSS